MNGISFSANAVLKINYFWTPLVRIGPGGPGQYTHQQKARSSRNGPAQKKHHEKLMIARVTQGGANNATAEATATEDATEEPTEKDGLNNRV